LLKHFILFYNIISITIPNTNKKCLLISLSLIVILLFIGNSDVKATPISIENTMNENGSPIVIYRDSYSPNSLVHIVIHAWDFNSNPYAIDTIGEDPENRITISTRGSSIPYKLVETGPDTGVFAGYVILSGTTSICSSVCGPTDGYLAASGDDAITVSFTYSKDRTMTNTMGTKQSQIQNQPTPEFGQLAELVIAISIIGVLVCSRKFEKN
jgi:hypothetical protein